MAMVLVGTQFIIMTTAICSIVLKESFAICIALDELSTLSLHPQPKYPYSKAPSSGSLKAKAHQRKVERNPKPFSQAPTH